MKFSLKFYIFMSLSLVIIILSNLIMCFFFINSYKENVYNIKTATKSYITTKIQNETKKLERIENEISAQIDLDNLINNDSVKLKSDLGRIIHAEVVSNVQPIQSILFDTEGKIVYASSDISETQTAALDALYKSYSKNSQEMNLFFFDETNIHSNEIGFCIFKEIKKMNYATASYENTGYHCLLSKIDLNEFFQEYELENNISIILFNNNYKVNFTHGKSNDTNLELGNTLIKGTNWRFNGYVSCKFKNNSLFIFMIIAFLETLLLMILIIIFIYDTNKYTLVPLCKIATYLDKFFLNQRFKPLSISATSEIESIVKALNNMIIKNKLLYGEILSNQEKLYEQEQVSVVTTMYALQSQVNPHFLYNTFEIIRSLAVINQISEIESITVYLARILRYNLNTNGLVNVKEELEIIKCYIAIMDVKYKDEFEIEYDIQEDVYEQSIIRMIFQPIVENSFNHGFSCRNEKFKIIISVYTDDGNLVLKFFDNGLGCSEKKLKQVQDNINKNKIAHKHIGLSNLYHRLYLQYHNDFSMEIDSVENKYTTIAIRIKIQDP